MLLRYQNRKVAKVKDNGCKRHRAWMLMIDCLAFRGQRSKISGITKGVFGCGRSAYSMLLATA